MFNYFRGWRRKAGLVTLLMACVFAAGWVRSLTEIDRLGLFGGWVCSWGGSMRLVEVSFITTQIGGASVRAAQLTPFFSIPYWMIVLPLTLLSAWLLLSKPRILTSGKS